MSLNYGRAPKLGRSGLMAVWRGRPQMGLWVLSGCDLPETFRCPSEVHLAVQEPRRPSERRQSKVTLTRLGTWPQTLPLPSLVWRSLPCASTETSIIALLTLHYTSVHRLLEEDMGQSCMSQHSQRPLGHLSLRRLPS